MKPTKRANHLQIRRNDKGHYEVKLDGRRIPRVHDVELRNIDRNGNLWQVVLGIDCDSVSVTIGNEDAE